MCKACLLHLLQLQSMQRYRDDNASTHLHAERHSTRKHSRALVVLSVDVLGLPAHAAASASERSWQGIDLTSWCRSDQDAKAERKRGKIEWQGDPVKSPGKRGSREEEACRDASKRPRHEPRSRAEVRPCHTLHPEHTESGSSMIMQHIGEQPKLATGSSSCACGTCLLCAGVHAACLPQGSDHAPSNVPSHQLSSSHCITQEDAARRREERFGSDNRLAEHARHSRDYEDGHRRPAHASDDARRRPAEPMDSRRRCCTATC